MALKRGSDAITEAADQGAEKKPVIHGRIDLTDGSTIDLGTLDGLIEFQNLPFEKVLGTGLMHLYILARDMYAAKGAEATLFNDEVIPIYCWQVSVTLHCLRFVTLNVYF